MRILQNYKMPKVKTNIATKFIDALDPKVLDILNSILSYLQNRFCFDIIIYITLNCSYENLPILREAEAG